MTWYQEQIAGILADISNERNAMQQKYGDQTNLKFDRHLAIVGEGFGNVCSSVNGFNRHLSAVGELRSDADTITFLKDMKKASVQTMATLVQLIETIKRYEASI